MANIPNASNVLPGVFTDVTSTSGGVAIPGGSRILAMVAEGSSNSTLVVSANGGGTDGLNPTYTSTQGADGRHFQAPNAPFISNRTTLFKNGIPLVGLEQAIDSSSFSDSYDYRIDIATGEIELQTAHLVDQGGAFYTPLSTNTGVGTLSSLNLVDANAPPEIWTVRCVGVQRNAMNQPVADTAQFLAFGSVSGTKIDANGNPIIWKSDGYVVSNGILSFAINETQSLGTSTSPFVQGDGFTIKVASGVLVRGDSLVINDIPSTFLNSPLLLSGMNDAINRHGTPSLTNNLSLGCQLAFANTAPALITVQAAPPMPRRTSYILAPKINSLSTNDDDFIFPLPLAVTPDFNSAIHFFVTNNVTNVETQILPNKLDFYTLDTAGHPTTDAFIMSNIAAPAGYSFFYTVKQSLEELQTGFDGYIGRDLAFNNKGLFGSSITFDSTYVGKTLKIIDAANTANIGTYTVNNVISGQLYVTRSGSFPDFATSSGVTFEVIDPATLLPVSNGSATDGTLVDLVSTATATLASNAVTGVNFSAIPNLLNMKLQINGSISNNGLYDIISGPSSNIITIKKTVVTETGMRYEVLDPNAVSNYIVINKNVVPNGDGLRVTIVDSRDAAFFDAGWENAIAALETIECDMVVPLPKQTISIIFQNILAHCQTMSNIVNRKERVAMFGAISGLTPANLIGTSLAAVEDIGILEGIQGETVTDVLAGNIEDLANYSVANAYGNTYRAFYFYPDQIVVQAGADNIIVSGYYLAAAAGGFFSADTNLQNPLTNKTLTGFTILSTKQYSVATLQSLAAAGVCVLQPVAGGGNVVWGITTSQSGDEFEQEMSVVFIRDRVAKTLRAGFKPYIGTPEDENTAAVLNTRAVDLLNSLVSSNLITAFTGLSVIQDQVDGRQWDISVLVSPTLPINWIYIKVALGQISASS